MSLAAKQPGIRINQGGAIAVKRECFFLGRAFAQGVEKEDTLLNRLGKNRQHGYKTEGGYKVFDMFHIIPRPDREIFFRLIRPGIFN